MSQLAEVWFQPRAGSSEVAQWYYVGRGALAHADWRQAHDAFARAVAPLRDGGEWALLWLCHVGMAAIAWRLEDGAQAREHAREAHLLADRLEGEQARVWSLWLLGHVSAAHHQRAEAAACFQAAAGLLGSCDDEQRTMLQLTAVAAMLCGDGDAEAEVLAERLFGLMQLSVRLGQRHALPLEALRELGRAPRLAREASSGRGPIEWLRSMLPRHEPAAPEPAPLRVPATAGAAEEPGPDEGGEPDVRAFCFGSFEVWVGHSLVTRWPGAKCKMLLKLLLASFPSQAPATALMEAMWPGVEEELARQRLHTAMSDLRRALRAAQADAGSLIVAHGGGYGLDPRARVWLDTQEFGRLQRVGRQYEELGRADEAAAMYRRAVALYRGEFLEEDLFEDWPLEPRERHKSAYLALLTRLGQWAFDAGAYDTCLSWGRMTLACDPCREDAHRLLMRCHSRLGQRTAAMRQYRQCVEGLRRELDALPEAESEELYRRLQQGLDI